MTRHGRPTRSRRGLRIAFAAMVAASLAPAAAWSSPFDFLFGNSRSEPSGDTASARSETQAPSRPVGMPVTAILPPRRPASLGGVPREAASAPDVAEASQPEAPVVAAAARAAPPASATHAAPLSDRAIVERANAYFNGLTTLVANFVQVGGDGRRLTGTLYVQRPGKLRFEYDPPATIEVIADGSAVAVRDRKLVTQDLYTVSQTPLKFLLRDRIELGRDIKVIGAAPDPEGVRVSLEDSSTLGGTSKIALFFDANVETLTKWRIVDPQGFQTTVALSNAER